MMGTVQNLSLLCCFALFFLLPHHLMADSRADTFGPFRASETASAQQQDQPNANRAVQNMPTVELNDVHDIYGPIPLPEPPPYHLYGFGMLLMCAAGALLLLLVRIRNKQKKTTVIDPAAQALANLHKAKTVHGKTGDPSHYCDEVSAILRTYIQLVSGYRVSSRTTLESLHELEIRRDQNPFTDSNRLDLLHRCFSRCDMVKFAQFSLDQTEVDDIGTLAASFISNSNLDETGVS